MFANLFIYAAFPRLCTQIGRLCGCFKKYKINPQIGKVKYSISFYDGVSTHKDGSPFWNIATFKRKTDLIKKEKQLKTEGYELV